MSSPPAKTSLFTKLVGVALVLLLLSCLFEEMIGVFAILGPLLTGWLFFLQRTWATMTVDRVALISALLCLAIVGIGLHWLCSWLWTAADGTRRRWPLRWSASLLIGLLLMFTAGISMVALAHQFLWLARSPRPIFTSGREAANRAKCSNNMRQIGLGIVMYCNDNKQQYPTDVGQLIPTQDLSAEVFVCPSSSDTKLQVESSQQAAALLSGEHCSYVYVGAGMTSPAGATEVVAFELPDNHSRDGGHLLHSDAHVLWVGFDTLVQLVPELEAGRNPPMIVPLTAAQAKTMYEQKWLPKLASIKDGTWAASLPRPATRPSTEAK